ncbi:MAG: DUF4465 domain-containing protein [Desulfobacteraceae bacterium]|jgi:hypothetical protein
MKKGFFVLLAIVFFMGVASANAAVADFDDLTLASESYWNGSDESGGFISGDAWFSNYYNTSWYSWDGWAYSNMTDTTTAGYTNQYSAITGGGAGGSDNYGVAYDMGSWGGASPPTISFGASTGEDYDTTITGAYFTNTTYAYYSMLNGDSYVTAFDEGDWQMMTITGIDSNGDYTSNALDFYLADYTSSDSSDWFILDTWAWVDLTSLGDIIGFEISFSGSQVDSVPTYVAMDSLNAVPVPAAAWLLGSGLLGLIGIRRRRGGEMR